MTKTRSGAAVFGRDAIKIEVNQDNFSSATFIDNSKWGSASVDQAREGIGFPNTQKILEEIVNIGLPQIGTVIGKNTAVNPGGRRMEEELVITGQADSDYIMCYGVRVPINRSIGTNKEKVSEQLAAYLKTFITSTDNISPFAKVVHGGASAANSVYVTFNDTLSHAYEQSSDAGITITGKEKTTPISGFGVWNPIGNIDIGSTKVYYYERTA